MPDGRHLPAARIALHRRRPRRSATTERGRRRPGLRRATARQLRHLTPVAADDHQPEALLRTSPAARRPALTPQRDAVRRGELPAGPPDPPRHGGNVGRLRGRLHDRRLARRRLIIALVETLPTGVSLTTEQVPTTDLTFHRVTVGVLLGDVTTPDPSGSTAMRNQNYERVNYDAAINGRLIVNGLGGNDFFASDDNSRDHDARRRQRQRHLPDRPDLRALARPVHRRRRRARRRPTALRASSRTTSPRSPATRAAARSTSRTSSAPSRRRAAGSRQAPRSRSSRSATSATTSSPSTRTRRRCGSRAATTTTCSWSAASRSRRRRRTAATRRPAPTATREPGYTTTARRLRDRLDQRAGPDRDAAADERLLDRRRERHPHGRRHEPGRVQHERARLGRRRRGLRQARHPRHRVRRPHRRHVEARSTASASR